MLCPNVQIWGFRYLLSDRLEVDYYSLLAWVGMWTGGLLIAIACMDLSAYICLCTRFLHDIYAVFVCTIYISDGMIGVSEYVCALPVAAIGLAPLTPTSFPRSIASVLPPGRPFARPPVR